MQFLTILLCQLLFIVTGIANASVFTPISDEDLLAQTEVVVSGTVLSQAVTLKNGRIETQYSIHVNSTLKGSSGSIVTVSVVGGQTANGMIFHVQGAPQFAAGEEVLLFLNIRDDGVYQLAQFFLGAFHIIDKQGDKIARRDLAGAAERPPSLATYTPKTQQSGQMRDAFLFMDWLEKQTDTDDNEADYWIESPVTSAPTVAEYETYGSRWLLFEQSQPATWYAHQTGQTSMSGGGYGETQQALDCWTNDAGSNIIYQYGGTTSASTGFQSSDGTNTILFNDPNQDIDGTYSCSTGGVLAVGGYWSSGIHSYKGLDLYTIQEGDVVVQNGAGCYLEGDGGKNGAEVFAHELGHSLGFGHSSDTDALMYSIAHGDGRGASLSTDDQNGAHYLYDAGIPTIPTGITATDGAYTDKIRIQWNSVSGATSYKLYRSNYSWQSGSEIYSGTALTYDDAVVDQGTSYYYQVSACSAAGCSQPSNNDEGYRKIAASSSPVATDGTYTDRVRITWAGISGATSYKIYRSESEGTTGDIIYSGGSLYFTDYTTDTGMLYYYTLQGCAAGCGELSQQDSGFRRIAAPSGLQASLGSYTDHIALSWEPVTGAESYQLYRSNTYGTPGVVVNDGTDTSWDDYTATMGMTYYYGVQACDSNGCSQSTSQQQGYYSLDPPGAITASWYTYNDRIVIDWSSVNGAGFYRLYRSGDDGQNYEEVYQGTDLQFIDSTSTENKTIYYKATACNNYGCSNYSYATYGIWVLPVSTSVNATDGDHDNKITITWGDVSGEVYYQLYRSDSWETTGILIFTSDATSYDDLNTVADVWYVYHVEACNTRGCGQAISDSGYQNLPKPSPPETINASDGQYPDYIKVSWSTQQEADYYQLFAYMPFNESGLLVYSSSGHEFYDYGNATSVMFYRVQACNSSGCSSLSSGDSGYVQGLTPPETNRANPAIFYLLLHKL